MITDVTLDMFLMALVVSQLVFVIIEGIFAGG